jgi:hypothetical protein
MMHYQPLHLKKNRMEEGFSWRADDILKCAVIIG